MFDVFFFEVFQEEAKALRSFLPADIKAGFTDKTIQKSGILKPPARLISIRTQSVIPEEWTGRIQGILSRSTGYDHLQAYCKRTGVQVPCGYLPLYCARSVAEHALILWMALLRKLPLQIRQFSNFHRDGLTGQECGGKYLLVVGVGNIGYQITCLGKGLGMSVHGVDIVCRYENVDYVSLEQGLHKADIIVCAMNLTEKNRGYFLYNVLKQCKPGLIFINIARGEFSPTADLVRLLDEGYLGAVGLDVYEYENQIAVSLRSGLQPTDSETCAVLELARRSNVILTPHNAFNTHEAVSRKAEQSISQVCAFLENGAFRWPIPDSTENSPKINDCFR